MKRSMVFLVATTVALGSFGQEIPPTGPFGGGGGGGAPERGERRQEMRERMGMRQQGTFMRDGAAGGNEMLIRLLQNPQTVAELGLGDEKAAALRDAFLKIQEKQIDLQAELAKLNLKQADLVASLLAERDKSAEETLKQVEAIGEINTALSKLAIDRILAIREHLTDDQIAKAREIANSRAEQMRERMRDAGGRQRRPGGAEGGAPADGGRRGERPQGEGRRGPGNRGGGQRQQ